MSELEVAETSQCEALEVWERPPEEGLMICAPCVSDFHQSLSTMEGGARERGDEAFVGPNSM